MAEAVRPVKKKKIAKKPRTQDRGQLEDVEEVVSEKKRDISKKVHEICAAVKDNKASTQDNETCLQTNVDSSEDVQKESKFDTVNENTAILPENADNSVNQPESKEQHKNIVSTEQLSQYEGGHGEINVDDRVYEETNVDIEGSGGVINEGQLGVILDKGDIKSTKEEVNLSIHGGTLRDAEGATTSPETGLQDEGTIDSEVQEETIIDNDELQEESDDKEQNKSYEDPSEQGDDTEETVEQEKEQIEDSVIKNESELGQEQHKIYLEQEDKNVSKVPDVVTKTTDEIEVNKSLVCNNDLAVMEAGQSEISSLTNQRQSESQTITQGRNLYSNIHSIFGKQQVSTNTRDTITAFTEDDLKSFYCNPALVHVEDSIEDFIQETLEPRRESEFYELLNTYQNASKNLCNVNLDIELLRNKCIEHKKTIWSTEKKTVTVQGMCKDLQKVSYTHSYDVAIFNKEEAKGMKRSLETLKSAVHETFTLAKYSCQLARVHIMSYIHELHAQSPVFCGVTEESPIVGVDPSQVSHAVFGEIQHLRDCISALFQFLRKPTKDEDFFNDVNLWLEHLVALLLRVATLPDHVFLLNHVLRCPPGITRKLAHFVQPLLLETRTSNASYDEYFWHNPLLHHFITMLANLLLPIKLREKYLLQMKSILSPERSESPKVVSWVMVDEDGEEDIDLEESWMLIPENDFVSLFSQFAFDNLYKIIFGEDAYDGVHPPEWESRGMNHQTAVNVMQVFAFSTFLVQMLGKAFTLYSMRRYREFVKRLGRAISAIVMHVSRYWAAYKSEYVNKYGDNEITFHFAFGSDYSLEKLQLEYDQFFIRASQQILSAHKLGVWQFLIDMPFNSLSSKMTWACYRFLHRGTTDKESFSSLSEYISSHSDQNETSSLLESFKTMNEAEIVFLLTTFSNMARARQIQDSDFINTVVREIYEVSYLNASAPDFLTKTGKDLLGSICQKHSFVISLLLERVENTLDSVREDCVALFQALPVETWRPKVRDIQAIRNWLLRSAVESCEHQLSRYLLTNINWQYQALDNDILYLPQCVHRAVAILLVETCALRLSNRPGGIAVDVFKETPGILEQVTQVAAHPYQRLMQHFTDQELYKWLWEVIMFLHLHQVECIQTVMEFTNTPSTSATEETVTSSYEQSEFFKNLSKSEPLDLDMDESLVNVLTSANKDGPVACFVALQLSSYGHDQQKFSDVGLTYMSVILEEGHVFPTCRIIENSVPVFFTTEHLTFSENTRFTKIIDVIIHSGAQWREQGALDILSGIIQKHVKRSSSVPDSNYNMLLATEFWLRALCCLPNWNTDTNVLQVLDNLLKCAFRNFETRELIVNYFVEKHLDTLISLKDQGFLTSLFSLVISHPPTSANLVDIKTFSGYVYFCYYVLCAESKYQEQCGLKSGIANKLHDKPEMCIETAIKKVSSSLKDVILIPSCNLDIYRWAELALSTDHEEPLLVVIWQKFFEQFFHRVSSGPGIPERGSVGLRFFESTANTTYLKQLKARLMGTSEHHKQRSTSSNENDETHEQEYRTPVELHRKLARLFQTLALWLDEPRLHGPSLFVQGLPPAYDADRLVKILGQDKNLWLDHVDIGKIEWQLNVSLQYWMRFNKERQKKVCTIQKRNLIKKPERITPKTFTTEETVKPPLFKFLSTPIPECPLSVLLDKYRVMETLERTLDVLTDYARKFMMKLSTNSALDYEYLEMLEHIYKNTETQLRVCIPCNKRGSGRKTCQGPANLVVKYHEKKLCEPVRERAAQNREEFKMLMREMLREMPDDICLSALCVEKTLTLLLKQWKSSQNPAIVSMFAPLYLQKSTEKFEDIGCSTFYMLIDMISDSVRQFPPTMQFFSTCVELLGKTFIMENRTQVDVLLRTILAHPKIVGLLLPIFQPNTCEDSFTEMYENVIQTTLDVEVKFSLLSKFDFPSWLTTKPTLSERMRMMKILFTALCDCGFEPPVKTTMLSEIYLRKVNVLLLYQFPDLFGETLSLLIRGSADHCLCVNSWNEFLVTTKILVKNINKRELELNMSPPFLLENEQVSETMSWLMEYFNEQRFSCTVGSDEGIYTLWKPYLSSLIALYEYICRHSIAAYELQLAESNIEVMMFLWNRISDFVSPWILPCENNSDLSLPWSEQEVSEGTDFVDLYVRVLIYFQNFLRVSSSCKPSILSLVWEMYISMTTKLSLPGNILILQVYHVKFTCLPWNIFYPNVFHLESMLKICPLSERCRGFIFSIFPRIPWSEVLQYFRRNESTATQRRYQNVFFNLLLVLGNEKKFIKDKECEMLTLVKKAVEFDWDLLEGSAFRSVCDWFVLNCDCLELLEPSSVIWHSIRLLQAVCLLLPSVVEKQSYADIPDKRLHYLNSMVKLLCKCSASLDHTPGLYRPIIEQLMDNVLFASSSDAATNSQNITTQYMEVLNLLNSLSPKGKVLVVALESIQEKIRDLTQTNVILAMIIAACRSLASISLMVQILEVAVETHFNNISLPSTSENSESQESLIAPWSNVLASVTVPELSQREFIQECINHNGVLTLFTHIVQCLSQCQSAPAEFNMLKDIIVWTTSIKPSDPETESKVILLWYKILQLLVRQLNYDANLRELGQQVDFLIPYIAHAGEDRDTTGLLGVIGLGRKSPLTPSFRFLCRALAAFLSAQLPSNGLLRVTVNAPGVMKAANKKEASSGIVATPRTNTAVHNLETLRLNKTYLSLVNHTEYACKFIVNPENCLRDGPRFLEKLTKDLFKDKSYLGFAV